MLFVTLLLIDFSLGVIFVFKDEDALKEYIPHKAHRDYQAYTAPYVEGRWHAQTLQGSGYYPVTF